MSQAQKNKREEIVKSMKKSFKDFRSRYGDKAKSVMYATATKQAMKEETDESEEGVHYCAKHVYHHVYGEGIVLEGQHAEPDSEGNIDWYTVEFGHGNETVMTKDVEVMVAEYHMNHKKKKKMNEEEAEESVEEKALHPNQQVLDVHEPEKDELTAKDFEMLRKIKKARNK